MSAKCAICKRAFVNEPGQICITCKMRQQPYQTGMNASQQTFPTVSCQYENTENKSSGIVSSIQPMGQDVEIKSRRGRHLYTGIVQNVHQSQVKKGILRRWFNSLLYGTPLPFSDIQYEFSLYEQENFAAGRVHGKEVVFYGDSGYCFLSNNSTVKVSGVTDRNGVLIADEISGVNTSFRMKNRFAISGIIVRLLTVVLIVVIAIGLIGVTENVNGCATSTDNMLFAIICILGAWFVIKMRIPKRFFIASILVAVGLLMVSPLLSCIIIAMLLLIKMVTGRIGK